MNLAKSLLILLITVSAINSANAQEKNLESSEEFCMCQIKYPHQKTINKEATDFTEGDCKAGFSHGTVTRLLYLNSIGSCEVQTVVFHKDKGHTKIRHRPSSAVNGIVRPSSTPNGIIRPSSTPNGIIRPSSTPNGVIRPSSTPD